MHQIIIIGGGPIGLNAALMAQKQNMEVLLLESSETLGGQLSELYPEKEIVDIPGIPCVTAQGYVTQLVKELRRFAPQISLQMNEKVLHLQPGDGAIEVFTKQNMYLAKNVIIATGLGTFIPRTMGLPKEQQVDHILYALKSLEDLRDQKVIVLGGGDAALDWAKMIAKVSHDVTLIHRRREFRGDFKTIETLDAIHVKTPYIPVEIVSEDHHLKGLIVQHVERLEKETLPADFVFVNYGHIPSNDLFGFEKHGMGIKVSKTFETSMSGVFAIGDISGYEGKSKRISSGLVEAEIVISAIKKRR
jgi:ferredoxin/flavodoxin---NADP+ reductase